MERCRLSCSEFFFVASALLAGAVTVLLTMVAGSDEEARFLTMRDWEGVLLLNSLYGVCITLSMSVLILSIAAIVQVLKAPSRTSGT